MVRICPFNPTAPVYTAEAKRRIRAEIKRGRELGVNTNVFDRKYGGMTPNTVNLARYVLYKEYPRQTPGRECGGAQLSAPVLEVPYLPSKYTLKEMAHAAGPNSTLSDIMRISFPNRMQYNNKGRIPFVMRQV